jgi:ubiquinol-cytochrome c reductase cytochrome c subunit
MRRLALLALLFALPGVAVAANGKQVYGRYCAMCHGPNAKGQTQSDAVVGGGPARDQKIESGIGPSLVGVGAMAADFYLRTGYMPLKRTGQQPRRSRLLLSGAQIDALVKYVASLGHGPPVPTPHPEQGDLSAGQHLFAMNCAGCHQIVARGGYVTHALPPPLGDATATEIAEAVRIGPYVMPRFSKKQISDAELNSLVRYVLWTHKPDDRGGWSLGRIGPVPEGLVTWFLGAFALIAVCLVIGKRLQHE